MAASSQMSARSPTSSSPRLRGDAVPTSSATRRRAPGARVGQARVLLGPVCRRRRCLRRRRSSGTRKEGMISPPSQAKPAREQKKRVDPSGSYQGTSFTVPVSSVALVWQEGDEVQSQVRLARPWCSSLPQEPQGHLTPPADCQPRAAHKPCCVGTTLTLSALLCSAV